MSIQGTLPVPALAPPVPLPRLTLTNKSQMGTYGGKYSAVILIYTLN